MSTLEQQIRQVLSINGAGDLADDVIEVIRNSNRKKLSDAEVRAIRAAARGGAPNSQIAEAYDLNPATVSRIVRGLYH